MFEVLKSKDVTPEDAFTAAYSAIRILQYRSHLQPKGYVRFLRGHKTTLSTGRMKLALQLLDEIEQHEKVKVTDLNPRAARKYELALASAVNKRAKVGVDLTRSRALIAQLEKETVSSR